ncbi:MAG: hypothetical protein ACRC16_20640, partial [Aeromonas salmonicida]
MARMDHTGLANRNTLTVVRLCLCLVFTLAHPGPADAESRAMNRATLRIFTGKWSLQDEKL